MGKKKNEKKFRQSVRMRKTALKKIKIRRKSKKLTAEKGKSRNTEAVYVYVNGKTYHIRGGDA